MDGLALDGRRVGAGGCLREGIAASRGYATAFAVFLYADEVEVASQCRGGHEC